MLYLFSEKHIDLRKTAVSVPQSVTKKMTEVFFSC